MLGSNIPHQFYGIPNAILARFADNISTVFRRGGEIVEDGTVFSRRITQLCSERGITVGKLCSMAGTTASTVHDIVSGVTANPCVFTLKKLCDALDITLADFFDCPEFNNMDEEIE